MDILINLLEIFALIASGAIFAMSEIALASARKVRLNQMAEHGDTKARLVLKIKDNPGAFFSVIQIGINAVAILGGIVGEAALSSLFKPIYALFLPENYLEASSFASSFLVITLLFVIFSDLIPKRVAMNSPEKIATFSIRWMVLLITIFKPVVWFLTKLSSLIIDFFGLPAKPADKITSEDIAATVEEGAEAGLIAPNEQAAITNLMGLETHLVPSAMTTRDSIIYIEESLSLEEIASIVSQKPHDTYLVCSETLDTITGCVESKDLVSVLLKGEHKNLKEAKIIKPALTVPDSITLAEILNIFKAKNKDFAVVVNEYALTVGVITLNDVLLSVMSEFVALSEIQIKRLSESTWSVAGSTPIDDIEKEFKIDYLPNEETYETLAGFMMYMLRKIPKLGDCFDFMGLRFEVTKIADRHVEEVLVTKLSIDAKPIKSPMNN